MILSDRSIRESILSGHIGVDPAPDMKTQLQPASLDLRLGTGFARFNSIAHLPNFESAATGAIVPGETDIEAIMDRWETKEGESYRLEPRDFVLATTIECVRIPNNLVARVEGRSSYGRLGLIVHSTAGFIDPGFEGNITLEMTNIGDHPIMLKVGVRICQLAFEKLDMDAESPYQGKYQGQRGVTASRLGVDRSPERS